MPPPPKKTNTVIIDELIVAQLVKKFCDFLLYR